MGHPSNLLLPVNGEGIDDEQLTFVAAVQAWTEREVFARRAKHRGDFDALVRPALRGLMRDLGLQAHLWSDSGGQTPREAALTLALALEQVGRADVGLGFVATSYLATTAAVRNQSPALRPPGLCTDADVIVSLVLPVVSPDAAPGQIAGRSMQATARLEDQHYAIQGREMLPSGSGQDATLFVVACSCGLLALPADAPGVRREATRQTGLEAARNARVWIDDARVDADALILSEPEGLRELRTWRCLGLAATCSGALLAGLEILQDWAASRVIKGRGQRFVDNSLVADLMAQQVQRGTLVQIAVRDLARLLAREQDVTERTHLTALTVAHHVAEQTEIALDAVMQLMGSAGYATEWNLEQYWRDVKTLRGHLGSQLLDRLQLARHCFGHGARG